MGSEISEISYNSLNINKIGHYFPVGLSRLLCILRPVGTNQNYIRRGRNLLSHCEGALPWAGGESHKPVAIYMQEVKVAVKVEDSS